MSGKGPFADCHDVLDPGVYMDDCTYDWCATESVEQLCEDISTYAVACQQRGVAIGDWREMIDCRKFTHKRNSEITIILEA